MMAAILNSAILDSAILHKKTSLIHPESSWWWQPYWILPCWILTLPSCIQPFCTKLWVKLIQSDSNSFILTQLDDVSHLEFCLLLVSHFAQKKLHSFILIQLDDGSHHEFCLSCIQPLSTKLWLKLIQSDSNSFILTQTWWCQPSWILPSSNQPFWTKKIFTHSFSLNLRMSAVLNSAFF